MAFYPTPTANDTGDILAIFRWVNNQASGGIFMLAIMFTIWAIAFIGSIAEGRKAYRAWIFANFISAILSIILGLLGMVQATYIYFFIILLAFGLVWAKLQESRG